MPRVLFTPFPDSAPPATPPQDYQNIQSSPAAFGALPAQAEEKTGAQLSQTGTELTNTYSELSAQQANSGFTDRVNKILFGDPDTPGDVGYYGMHGQAAMDNRATTLKAIDTARRDSLGGLATTQSQIMFNNEARYYTARITGEIGRHYDQESKTWAGTVQTTRYNDAMSDSALRYSDDGAITQAMGKATSALVQKAQTEGLLPIGGQSMTPEQSDLVKSYQHQAQIGVTEEAIKSALGRNDVGRAQMLFNSNKDVLSTSKNFDALAQHLKSGSNAALGDQWLNEAQGHATISPSPSGGNAEVQSNNFAGMRNPNAPAAGGPQTNPQGWQHFDTPEAGITAISHQLDRYASGATTGKPLNTIREIVSTWAPPTDNNPTDQLINRASQIVGAPPDQPLNVADPTTKAKLVEAMIRGEQGGNLPPQANPQTIARVVGSTQATAIPPGQPATPPVVQPPGMGDLAQMEVAANMQHAAVLDRLGQRSAENPEAWAHAVQKEALDYNKKIQLIGAQKNALVMQQSEAADDIAKKIASGQVGPDTVDAIATAPIGEQLRTHLMSVLKTQTANTANGDTAKYGAGYFDTLQRLTLPDGDPNRIRDPSQLIAMVVPKPDGTQTLTTAGMDRLRSELQAIKGGPEGQGTTKMVDGMLSYGKNQLVFNRDFGLGGKLEDKNGEALFNTGFLPAFYKFYDSQVSAGKSPQEILTKENIDGIMKPFVRTPAQLAKDLTDAQAQQSAILGGGTEAGAEAPKGSPDMTTQAGIIAAYRAGQISRNDASAALVKGGFAAPAAPPVPVAPSAPLAQ